MVNVVVGVVEVDVVVEEDASGVVVGVEDVEVVAVVVKVGDVDVDVDVAEVDVVSVSWDDEVAALALIEKRRIRRDLRRRRAFISRRSDEGALDQQKPAKCH